ncbi:hypothetical protein ACIHCQ_29175 [Streptomyces sp. NPDC052236]|uniref:hypothetical protein n=1 Tax=Streptomyces sp. NPDC052236 TaxID=3365686 RepID=UPI0037CDF29B
MLGFRVAGRRQPLAIEDSAYANGARILADKGILLKKGDGNLLLAECGQTADQIKELTVKSASAGRGDVYRFQAITMTGYLALELSRAFALDTVESSISVDLTANGTTTTV